MSRTGLTGRLTVIMVADQTARDKGGSNVHWELGETIRMFQTNVEH